jgi:hypothetical protein
MKGLHVLPILAVFVLNSASAIIPPNRTLVYKGTIKASNSIFDVNDPSRLFSQTIKAYWAVQINTEFETGSVFDSNAVFYDKRNKYYKVVPNCISIDPCDPCNVVMFRFLAVDHDGLMGFYAVGKGRVLKFSGDITVAPDYTPKTLKGTGTLLAFDVFDPNDTVSGPITVTMTLDSAKTRAANPDGYPDNNLSANQVINDIVSDLTEKGGWTKWPFDQEIL